MPQYVGTRYKQASGKPLVSFIALAEEIRTWGGVPSKTTDFVGGFQRPLSNRFHKLIEFFDAAGNSSPTAIVVAFRPAAVKIMDLPPPANWTAIGNESMPSYVVIDIPAAGVHGTIHELAAEVHRRLASRLQNDTPSVPADVEDNAVTSMAPQDEFDSDSEEPVPIESEDSDSEDWGVDVGESALIEFSNHIASRESVDAYLESLAEKLLPEAGTPDEARNRAEENLRDVLQGLLQPAMIVDGQHRVWGASECSQDVPFTVIALPDAEWEEQVFQFVVVNKQARAISGEFLASIVNSSLTNREILRLEDRLEAAGLSTYETRMLRLMNDDPDSPFQGLISRGLEEQGQKITFKAAMALASRWQRRMNDRDPSYKVLFRPHLGGASSREKLAVWQSGEWKTSMFAFWNGIHRLYKEEQLWEAGTQLMYRATLETLQENFLTTKANAGVSFATPIALRESVEEFYAAVPAGFFHTEWKRKELLTYDGRTVLKEALNEMRIPGTKLKTLIKSNPLFTGANTKSTKRA
jgi:hypothetical protein